VKPRRTDLDPAVAARAGQLFDDHRRRIARQTDRLFAGLMVAQYLAAIVAAVVISPRTWAGLDSRTHVHVWAAAGLGAAIASLPIFFALTRPARTTTRHVIAAGQMLMSALLIHLMGGRIETHFHVFGSLALLAFYRDWTVLVTASAVVAADHLLRGWFWPASVFGVLSAPIWRPLEHAGWVLFEDTFLIGSCLRGVREMGEVAVQRARLEATQERIEQAVEERTRELAEAQGRLTAAAEFAAALNQTDALGTYRAALHCLTSSLHLPAAVVYAAAPEGPPIAKCAIALDDQLPETAGCAGAGLPAAVLRTGEVQELAGPFADSGLKVRVGLGEVELERIIGWPIRFNGRTLGALVTAHLAPPSDEQRAVLRAALDQLGVRMSAFAVEEQRLRLLADLREQSRALETARAEAERASRVKSEFLANMSHELRTPMNSIMGFTARLIRKLGDSLAPRELDALRTVDSNARHLLGLINSILDLSKIEAGKMELKLERLDLAALAHEVVDAAAALTDGRPIVLRLEAPEGGLAFDGDRLKLKQVLTNLTSNGLKYTEQGSVTVSVRAGDDAKLGPCVRVAVRDTGVGIKPEDRPRLFQQFTQLDGGTTRKVGGTGLGLVITDQFVRMHSGRIDVDSEMGRGSEFAVVLPVARERTSPTPPPPTVRRATAVERKGLTVLCIEDDADLLECMRLTFEEAGYSVLLARDFAEATQGARRTHPDLVCLDLGLPGRDGFDVLAELRSDPALAATPVIVVSGRDDEARALAAGARCYLAKPVETDNLLATVRETLACEIHTALVVEDDPDTARLVAETLVDHGIEVRQARHGREALERLAEALPSVILLDLMMPVMDGFTFLEHIQVDPAWKNVPVVILTAKALDADEVARLSQVTDAILTKGRGDTERVVEALLTAVGPQRRRLTLQESHG
jgi:signal transduction histidine kinase/DNA-binding response OmpR family regulator